MICDHKDYKIPYQSYSSALLNRCNKCGFIISDRYSEKSDFPALYKDYYKNEINGRFYFSLEKIIRLFRFFRAFKIFTIAPRAKSILDIGSGRGFMLYYLKRHYHYQRTAGTQISKNALEFSRNKLGLEIYDKDLLELSFNNKFDIITMWHVLEHIACPEGYIEKIYSLLHNHGRLVIEVPNFNSWTSTFTGEYWLGLDLDYHVTFFTPESLSYLLEKYNFKIRKIRTFSLEYSTFISVQSLVSLVTKSNHIFFNYLQTADFNLKLTYHFFLFLLLCPICFLINLLFWFSKKGEVLLIVAEKHEQ